MKPAEAPIGTIVCMGHPANGQVVRKVSDNLWLGPFDVYTNNSEAFRAARALWVPGYETRIIDPRTGLDATDPVG